MDASILQLFAADEILERLARKQASGGFKAFTPQESADVFFKKGLIVAAIKGEAEGEDALKQILQWKEALYLWQQEAAAPASLKSVEINVTDFLAAQKIIPRKKPDVAPRPTTSTLSKVAATKALLPAGGVLNGAMPKLSEDGAASEEEFLRKHPMVLVSMDDPNQKFKIALISSLVGRNPTCNISIPDASISRQHCLLQITTRGLYVKDLNTVNGTRINGIVLKEGYISVGDKLTVGHLRFTLEKA